MRLLSAACNLVGVIILLSSDDDDDDNGCLSFGFLFDFKYFICEFIFMSMSMWVWVWVCMCVLLSYTDTLVFTCVPTYARIFTITYNRNMLRLNRIENDEIKLTSRLVAKGQ